MEKKVDDQKLVKGLLGGSEKWLRVFYRHYVPRLRRFVAGRVKYAEDAEEIVQDSVLSALDSLVLFSGRSKFFTWLCSIAKHEIADYYRKKKLKTVVFSKLPFIESFVGKAISPSAEMMRREYEARVGRALEMILPHYREILELKYMDDLSVKEIAGKIGKSIKATESALFRAREAFAVAYEEVS